MEAGHHTFFLNGNGSGDLELSSSQNQILLSQESFGKTSLYNLTFAFAFPEKVDIQVFKHAFKVLTEEAECLRLSIEVGQDRTVQRINPATDLALEVVDFSRSDDPEKAYQAWAAEQAARPVDLSQLVLGSYLAIVGSNRSYWLLVYHHIIADSWGVYLLYKRLTEIYRGLLERGEVPPASLLPYSRAIEADLQYTGSADFFSDQAYWKEVLKQAIGRLSLFGQSSSGDIKPATRVNFNLDEQVVRRIAEMVAGDDFRAKNDNIALYNILLTGFVIYLARISGENELMVAFPFANRRGDMVNVPGLTVEAGILQATVEKEDTFRTVFERIRASSAAAAPHSRYPIINAENKIYNVMINYHNRPYAGGGNTVETWWFSGTEINDLVLNVWNPDLRSGKLMLGFDFADPIFEPALQGRVIDQFAHLLEALINHPDQPVYQPSILSPSDIALQLGDPPVEAQLKPDELVGERFERQVRCCAESIAIVEGDTTITFQELERRSRAIAQNLVKAGIQMGDAVGLLMGRSSLMLAGMMGILRSGAMYVPLDTSYPRERLDYIIQDAGVDLIIVKQGTEDFAGTSGVPLACIDELEREPGMPVELPALEQDSPAYVVYTSGSTGHPKGVQVNHGSFASYLDAIIDYFRLTNKDRVLFLAPTGFDASIEEIVPTWLSGATVVPAPEGVISLGELNRIIREDGITMLSLPVALWGEWTRALAEDQAQLPEHLKQIIVYAEEPSLQDYRIWQRLPGADKVRWINGYGPTESVITATCYDPPASVDTSQWSRMPIGPPIRNHTAYVLDCAGGLVPQGVVGEICIGGDTATGYLNLEETTRKVFVPDPFASVPGRRMYRTGDRGRFRADGLLEFLGRIDSQVKIHGFRVEVGEIESQLLLDPGVQSAVVITRGTGVEQKLIAYIIARRNQSLDAEAIKERLGRQLPHYMIPADIVFLDAFPITPNGKVDKRALPDPDSANPDREVTAPESVLEAEIVGIWKAILGIPHIGIDQDFFALGGNSLLSIRMFAQLERKLGVRMPVSVILEAPTVRQLAQRIAKKEEYKRTSTLVILRRGDVFPPLFMVHGWGGGVIGYTDICQRLSGTYPIYGIQAAGMATNEKPDFRMEAVVERYIQAIKRVQTSGPYRICGYCTGGVIAYAVACQLRAQGDEVDFVGIIDGSPPKSVPKDNPGLFSRQRANAIRQTLPFWRSDYRELGWEGITQRFRQKMRGVVRDFISLFQDYEYEQKDVILDYRDEMPEYHRAILLAQLQMMAAYMPVQYDGDVVVFSAKYRTITGVLTEPLDPRLGWDKLVTGEIRTRELASGHRNIHLPPNSILLARAIQEEIERADARISNKKTSS